MNAIFFTDDTDNIASIPPLGAYKCAHVLRQAGYKVLVVNHFSAFTESEIKELIDLSVTEETKVIGFSTTFFKSIEVTKVEGQPTPQYPDLPANTFFPHGKAVEDSVVKYLKQKNKDIKILVGGAKVHPNMDNKNINYVCIGYSEVSIVNLMDHVFKGVKLNDSYRNLFGLTIIDDRMAKSYDFVNSDFVWLPEDIVNHKALPFEVARGCIFQCKFCSYPMNGKQNLDFVRSEDQLYAELKHNYDMYGIVNYLLVDDTFNDHENKLLRLQRVVKRLPFQPYFWGYHRLDLIATRPHTLDILYDIGVRSMFFGIETLNPKSAKMIGKGFDINRQLKMIEHIRKNYPDITIHGSFIIGLPEDTEENALMTYHKLVTGEIPLHSWNFYPLVIYKQDSVSYASDIIKNFSDYGYEELTTVDKNLTLNNTNTSINKVINWKNKHTTFERSAKLSNFIVSESRLSNKLHMTGQFAVAIATMNDPRYSFEIVRNTIFKDFNFHDIEVNVWKKFIEEYKRKLFEIIRSQLS